MRETSREEKYLGKRKILAREKFKPCLEPGAAVWEAQMLTLCYAYPKIVDILPTPSFKNWRVNVLVFVLPFPDNATRVVMTAAPL